MKILKRNSITVRFLKQFEVFGVCLPKKNCFIGFNFSHEDGTVFKSGIRNEKALVLNIL